MMDWQKPSGAPSGALLVGLLALGAGLLIGSAFAGPQVEIEFVEALPPDCAACG